MRSWFRTLLMIGLAVLFLGVGGTVRSAQAAKPRVHRVYRGQHLGMIAKRYNVTVAALRNANGLNRSSRIRPGQKLLIPPKNDPDGSRTRQRREAREEKRRKAQKRPLRVHRVARGQHLGMIAKRYGVSVNAIRRANSLKSKAIRPGQKLYIPHRSDKTGNAARRRLKERAQAATSADKTPKDGTVAAETDTTKKASTPKGKRPSWMAYEKRPRRKGYINVVSYQHKWRGKVFDRKGKLRPAAKRAWRLVMSNAQGQKVDIHPRLLRHLVDISDTFGGRRVRIVSGFRIQRGSRSHHVDGTAVDFAVDGLPNKVLREYLWTLPKVGIGYYPNSHFIHLDVRKQWTYWVDNSGPGKPAQYVGFWVVPPNKGGKPVPVRSRRKPKVPTKRKP